MKNCNDKIAEAAYFIWQAQGCPNGMEDAHWALACEQLSKGCKKTTCATKKASSTTKKAPAKKAKVTKKATASKK